MRTGTGGGLKKVFFMDRAEAIDKAKSLLSPCKLCPRECGVDRPAGEEGFCGMRSELVVSSHGPHFGEEPELVGVGGSGTIFLAGCNLGCVFCQNDSISHGRSGRTMGVDRLVEIMLSLEAGGCHNINFVTPTHFTPQLMAAIPAARDQGLAVPIVYNCSGYESVETLVLLDGFVEIYMPDLKFVDPDAADAMTGARDYPERVRAALREMHRQVGDFNLDKKGVATGGLLVRHLVLPRNLAGTEDAMRFLADEISTDTYVNIMNQYRPCFKADEFSGLDRPLRYNEYLDALDAARKAGLHRGF